ncbi:hypothetical protein RUM44_010842 [Polyplax serrata]|uniref:Uncharacterized protein n=1 Tax=Polyplax serrata TaxID=468196 RepID=A0ABR1ANB1_POLSC
MIFLNACYNSKGIRESLEHPMAFLRMRKIIYVIKESKQKGEDGERREDRERERERDTERMEKQFHRAEEEGGKVEKTRSKNLKGNKNGG